MSKNKIIILSFVCVFASLSQMFASDIEKKAAGSIDFKTVFQRIVENNPDLQARKLAVEAAEGYAQQAAALPNPEFFIEFEELSHPISQASLGYAETSYQLSQLIQLGGKRNLQKTKHSIIKKKVFLDYEIFKLELWRDAVYAFSEVLAGQEKLRLAQETHRIFTEAKEAALSRSEAGKVPPLEAIRAEAELALSLVDLIKVQNELTAAKIRLSVLWGTTQNVEDSLMGNIEILPDLPYRDSLFVLLEYSPFLISAESEIDLSKKELTFQQRTLIPDIEISAGIKRIEAFDTQSYIASIAIPIPMFDRNRGNVNAAKMEYYGRPDTTRGSFSIWSYWTPSEHIWTQKTVILRYW